VRVEDVAREQQRNRGVRAQAIAKARREVKREPGDGERRGDERERPLEAVTRDAWRRDRDVDGRSPAPRLAAKTKGSRRRRIACVAYEKYWPGCANATSSCALMRR
jgi:hypothetical protein